MVKSFRAQTCDQLKISRAVFRCLANASMRADFIFQKCMFFCFSLSLRLCFAFEVSWHLSAMCGDNVVVVCVGMRCGALYSHGMISPFSCWYRCIGRHVVACGSPAASWGLIVNSSSKRQERTQLEGNLVVSRHVPCCVGIEVL